MKIREYNEMMRYLTRPKEKFKGTFVKQKTTLPQSLRLKIRRL